VRFAIVMLTGFTLSSAAVEAQTSDTSRFYPMLRQYIDSRVSEFDKIPDERKAQLRKLADYVKASRAEDKPVKLVFICTHNSRRSHMAQIWAAMAATHFGVGEVTTYSGGTEATAFNARAIAAIERAGFRTEIPQPGSNPRCLIRFEDSNSPLSCFSKKYDDETNPHGDFCAVMTCSQADAACPLVAGSDLRIALPYEDPKVADNTPREAATYDERCAQIGREMLFVFSEASRMSAAN
jgi:arsenate reductase (thioredoxin)